MRPVNLLPERHRPRQATGGQQGSSYVVLGALGVVLLALVAYVLTLNSINSGRTDIAQAKAETEQSQARARALSAYGNFAKVKDQRVASVKQLAEGRFDWERLVRELAHVLPEDVWLKKSEASALPPEDPSNQQAAAGGPTLKLNGCAPSQSQVAVTLVRLRELQGSEDVKLVNSEAPDEAGGSGGSSGGSEDCGKRRGVPNYAFEVQVTFAAKAGGPNSKTPGSLGGGK